MISIDVEHYRMKQIEEFHWKWFKKYKLKNLIHKISKSEQLRRIFFGENSEFETWFDKHGQSTENWLTEQSENKLNIFKTFIIGKHEDLEKLKNDIGIISDIETKNYFKNRYSEFRSNESYWNGSILVKKLGVRVCPYCNRNFIDTYTKERKVKSNVQIDHFYPIDKYPYLGLSLYNLIPSCAICNKAKLNHEVNIIYPYDMIEGNYGKDAKFKTSFYTNKDDIFLETEENICNEHRYDVDYLLGNSDNFKIEIDIINVKSQKGKKIKNSIELFNLDYLYSLHKDYVRELIKKAVIYNESRITELYKEYGELFNSREELIQIIVGNYVNDEELGKRPLAKLIKDISEDLGIK